MDKFVVEGGHPLEGSVEVRGSKNAVLPVMAAALLADEPLRIENAPALADVETMVGVLRSLGCKAERDRTGALEICAATEPISRAGWEHVRRMRGSVTVLGPLLARTGGPR